MVINQVLQLAFGTSAPNIEAPIYVLNGAATSFFYANEPVGAVISTVSIETFDKSFKHFFVKHEYSREYY